MPFILLDRDGVINYDSEAYIKSPQEWEAIPHSLEAIAQLNRCHYRVVVVTNQSGVARGYYDLETLSLIHEKFIRELAAVGGYVEEIFFCLHHPDESCACRKPKPGLFHQIAEKYPIDFSRTFFIGDSLSDVQAAKCMNCIPLLVRTGKGELTLQKHPELAVPSFTDLADAVEYVLSHEQQHAK